MAKKKPAKDKKPDPEANARRHANQVLTDRRVTDIVRVRLEGAEWWDVRDYVRSQESEPGSNWFLRQDETPMSEAQIRRYQQKADEAILSSGDRSRKRLFKTHLAKRRYLYGRAVTSGELAVALNVLKDDAELLGLYPAKRQEHTFPQGLGVAPEDVKAGQRLAEEYRRERLADLPNSNGSNHTTNDTGR